MKFRKNLTQHRIWSNEATVQFLDKMFWKPKIDNKEIYLNGDGEKNLDHETFRITKKVDPKRPWGFTKTARKPYDAVVATILVGIKKIAPKKFEPRADGSLRVGGINKWSKEH